MCEKPTKKGPQFHRDFAKSGLAMGGFGSGRWSYHTRRRCVGEETGKLPAAQFAQFAKQCLLGGWETEIAVRGSWPDGAVLSATLRRSCSRGDVVPVVVTVDTQTPWQPPRRLAMRQVLTLIPHIQPRGGVRWTFRCPDCGGSALAMYVAPYLPEWRCRRCCGLRYDTQLMAPHERHAHRARVRARRAGASWLDADSFPSAKPKGMHWRTFDRLASEWEAATERWDVELTASLMRLMGRFGGSFLVRGG